MKVCALVHYYPPHYMAGSETMLHAMLRALAEAGHEVDVVVTEHRRGPAGYEHEGVRVRQARTRAAVDAALNSIAADVLVSHHQEAPNASRYARVCRRTQRPVPRVVHLVHNTFPGPVQQARNLRPELLVFNSRWVFEGYRRRGAILRGSRAVVVRPPVWPAEHATTPGDLVTLVNLNRDKGGEILYCLAQRMPDIAFAGVIGGHGQQITRKAPNVEVIPHTADMRRNVWSRTRVLIMPSVYESYGMAGVEAMASGIPVIAAPTPGLRESLGDAGTFVDRDDLDGWQREIRRLTGAAAWAEASVRALARSAELDPREELDRWVSAVESLS